MKASVLLNLGQNRDIIESTPALKRIEMLQWTSTQMKYGGVFRKLCFNKRPEELMQHWKEERGYTSPQWWCQRLMMSYQKRLLELFHILFCISISAQSNKWCVVCLRSCIVFFTLLSFAGRWGASGKHLQQNVFYFSIKTQQQNVFYLVFFFFNLWDLCLCSTIPLLEMKFHQP